MIKRKAQIFKPEGGDGRNGEEFLQSPEFSNKHARPLSHRPTDFRPLILLPLWGKEDISRGLGMTRP